MSERMTPSSGLDYRQISKILCEAGMGAKLYEKEHPLFKQIFTCYIESGLPLAVCVDNTEAFGNTIHSVVCIGRKELDLKTCGLATKDIDGLTVYSWNDSIDEFVFNDDNCSCYRIVPFEKTGNYYSECDEDSGEEGWDDIRISGFIVPLPEKVYMDAEIAIKVSDYYAVNILDIPAESVMRTFLVSNRTYKDYVMHNDDFSQEVKEFIVALPMPKFVWVTEISTVDSFRNHKTNSLVLLDATSVRAEGNERSVILAVNGDEMFYYSDEIGDLDYVDNIFAKEFESFTGNLK